MYGKADHVGEADVRDFRLAGAGTAGNAARRVVWHRNAFFGFFNRWSSIVALSRHNKKAEKTQCGRKDGYSLAGMRARGGTDVGKNPIRHENYQNPAKFYPDITRLGNRQQKRSSGIMENERFY